MDFMKKTILAYLLLTAVSLKSYAEVAWPIRVVFLDFNSMSETDEDTYKKLRSILPETLEAALLDCTVMKTVERKYLDKTVLEELQYQYDNSALFDEEAKLKLRKFKNPNVVVVGQIRPSIYGEVRIDIKFVEIETSERITGAYRIAKTAELTTLTQIEEVMKSVADEVCKKLCVRNGLECSDPSIDEIAPETPSTDEVSFTDENPIDTDESPVIVEPPAQSEQQLRVGISAVVGERVSHETTGSSNVKIRYDIDVSAIYRIPKFDIASLSGGKFSLLGSVLVRELEGEYVNNNTEWNTQMYSFRIVPTYHFSLQQLFDIVAGIGAEYSITNSDYESAADNPSSENKLNPILHFSINAPSNSLLRGYVQSYLTLMEYYDVNGGINFHYQRIDLNVGYRYRDYGSFYPEDFKLYGPTLGINWGF